MLRMSSSRSQAAPLLTVREIARRIRRDDEDLDVVINRLRNWTKEGLLAFSGNKHPGTGKSRLYPEYAVIDAVVLSALTATGIPAVRAGRAGAYGPTLLQLGRLGYQEFPEKEKAGETIFLAVLGAEVPIYEENPNRAALAYARDGITSARLAQPQGSGAEWDVVILLNLSNLFRRLRKRMGED
jgi:hypothetical protein